MKEIGEPDTLINCLIFTVFLIVMFVVCRIKPLIRHRKSQITESNVTA